jgi:methylated-DNA-[protein]-cysteine S-methyltransferase
VKRIQGYCKYILKSKFGEISIIWRYDEQKIVRVFLPSQHRLLKASGHRHAVALKMSDRGVYRVCTIMDKLLQGRPAVFPLDMLDWSVVYPFQRRVLRLEHRIPHGMVSTYGRLAQKLGHARAARAVGTALARNPFPVIIPCHRVVRSDRTLGGYAGGLLMKRRLLELEGMHFDRYGRVLAERFW